MKYAPENNTLIPLRLTDGRCRGIRAAAVRDLKIWVWTQDPRRFLTFHLRDIRQEADHDVLVIPEFEMSALPRGVVVYRYSFKEHQNHHSDLHGHHHSREYERTETVYTDILWKGGMPDARAANPVNYETLEHIKDEIETTERTLNKRINDLRHYIEAEYPDKLTDEVERALAAEQSILDTLKAALKDLREDLSEQKVAEDRLSEEKLTEIKNSINSINKVITQLKEKGKTLNNAIEAETSRAKKEEDRIEQKIDGAKDLFSRRLEDVVKAIKENSEQADKIEQAVRRNRNMLNVITGDENTIGSIQHAMKDCKHYTDDRTLETKNSAERDLHKAFGKIRAVPLRKIRKWFL